jgi:hypothetical protein
MGLTVKNPYNLTEGQDCYQILVKADFIGHDKVAVKFEGAYAIPMEEAAYHPDELEGAATLAFKLAQQDGLTSSMMAFCQFAHWDDEEDGWVEILFGEEEDDE